MPRRDASSIPHHKTSITPFVQEYAAIVRVELVPWICFKNVKKVVARAETLEQVFKLYRISEWSCEK